MSDTTTENTGSIDIAPIVAMTMCVFALCTAEYAVIGVLPNIGGNLGISTGTTGMLVTAYALTVAIAGPIITLLTARYPRKATMIALMAVFLVGNVLCAVTPDFAVLLLGRIVSAAALSTFAALSIVTVVSLVPPARIAAAISWVASGLILAMILGAPIGTAIGQHLGWRMTFWALAVASIAGIIALTLFIRREDTAAEPTDARTEIRKVLRPKVLVALLFSVLGQTGFFTAYTYIATMLTHVTGFAESSVSGLLLLFGLGGLVGNLLGAKLADRALMPAITGLLLAMALILTVLSVALDSRAPTIILVFLLGAAGFSVVPGYQTRILGAAGGSTLAVATNTSGINVGIALGAVIGTVALDSGLGVRDLAWVGAIPTAAAAVLAAGAWRSDHRSSASHPAETAPEAVEPMEVKQ